MRTIDPSLIQEDIAVLAYRLWEEAGRPGDRELEFWFSAEQQLSAGPRAVGDPITIDKKSGQTRASRKRRI